MDRRVEWDAEVINERQNDLIAWRSLPGSTVDTAGSVHFTPAPGDRGTEVKVTLKYDPPGGKVGAAVAWMFGREPSQEISEDLRRLKRFLETGEVPTTLGQPSGRGEEQWEQTGLLVLENRAARGLGWFSIGLGLAEVLAPEWLGETIGVGPDHRAWLPILGLREIASGVGILNQVRPTPWVWSRVVGDAIDLAFLGSAATEPGAKPGRLALAAAAVLGVTALDALCGMELSRDPREASGYVPRNGNGHAGGQALSR
jgi:hypothetical protein